jgi:hypothetical protein
MSRREVAWLTLGLAFGCGTAASSAEPTTTTDSDASTGGVMMTGTTGAGSGSGGTGDTTSSAETTTDPGPPTGTDTTAGSDDTTAGPSFVDPRGYTLLAPLASRYTYLVDADGMQINRWESPTNPANSAYLLPNGHLLRVGRDPAPAVELVSGTGGYVEEIDWDGNVVWQYTYGGPEILAHHDIAAMPNGHVLIVAYEMFDVAQAVAAGADPATLPPDGRWADHVVEVDPSTDTIVWEWHVWDHLVQDFDPLAANYGVVADSPGRIDINWDRPGTSPRPDWTHTNAIAYRENLDQIVLSPRTFSEVWIIDHSTTTQEAATSSGGQAGHGGDLLYRWGNPAAFQAGDDGDRQLYFQHNPHWLADDDRLLVFDNGDPMLRPWSRVIEVQLPQLADGTYELLGPSYGPAAPSWVYESPKDFFASFISGADRLSDGRTLICNGPAGELFEVDAAGRTQWEFAVTEPVFRAERYEADDPAFAGLTEEDLVPSGPFVVDHD